MKKTLNAELERKTVDEFKESTKTPIIVVLDNVRSLNNIGSVFRTADAFLIEAIYLCGITGQPPHKDIQKTALGSTESVAWKYFEKTEGAVTELLASGREVYAIEQVDTAIMLDDFNPKANVKLAVVFGNEVKGVAQSVINNCTNSIEIPQVGTKHSLNISVSVGVILWDLFSKLKQSL